MVATPDMVHKTLAEDHNLMDAEQITDTGNDMDTTVAEVAELIRNLVAFRLGLVAVVLLLLLLVILIVELLRSLFLWKKTVLKENL